MRTQEERDEQTVTIALMVFATAGLGVLIVLFVVLLRVLIGD